MLALPRPPQLRRPPPIWREGRTGWELAALVRDPVFRHVDPSLGGGRPVMLVPGFLAGDGSLGVMTGWLRRSGYRTRRAGMRFNVGCSTQCVDLLESRAEELADQYGQRVALIGQSRGGTLGRALAVRRPDLVKTLIALGSPQLDPLGVHPLVKLQVHLVGALGTLGVPGLFRDSCRRGECCREFRDSLTAPFPDRRALRVDLFAERRDRRLALVPRSGRRAGGGGGQPHRDGGQRARLPSAGRGAARPPRLGHRAEVAAAA